MVAAFDVAFTLWFAAAGVSVIQVIDLIVGAIDRRTIRDYRVPSKTARLGLYEQLWIVVGGALLAVVAGFFVDYSARIIFDSRQPAWGISTLVVTLVGVAIVGVLLIGFARRDERTNYATLRQDVRDLTTERVGLADVAALREQLEVVDGRQRSMPATLWAHLFTVGAWRLLPSLAALASLVIAVVNGGWGQWWTIALAVLVLIVTFGLAAAESWSALERRRRWHTVHQAQRAEVDAELQALERRANRGVPGLGDRVSRALQILREQDRK